MFLGPMTKNESIYVIVDFFCMLWKLIKKKPTMKKQRKETIWPLDGYYLE